VTGVQTCALPIYEAKEDGTLSFGDVFGTLAWCEKPGVNLMEQESQYFAALGGVFVFEIKQNHLRLFYDDRNGVLNYLGFVKISAENGL